MKNASRLSKFLLALGVSVLLCTALPIEVQSGPSDAYAKMKKYLSEMSEQVHQTEIILQTIDPEIEYEADPVRDLVDVPDIPDPMTPMDESVRRSPDSPDELAAQTAGMTAACSADRANLDSTLIAKTDAQKSPAAQIAVLMVALAGPPSGGRGGDICDDVERVALFTPEDVQEAVAGAISASHDPAAAAHVLLLAGAALPSVMQEAIGYGLALATYSLSASKYNKETNSIINYVSSTKNVAMQVAYFGDVVETGETKKIEMTKIRLNRLPVDSVPEHHASES